MHPTHQGSCHSNCEAISCSGATCSLTYQSSSTPLQLFNVKKTNASGETDRSERYLIRNPLLLNNLDTI